MNRHFPCFLRSVMWWQQDAQRREEMQLCRGDLPDAGFKTRSHQKNFEDPTDVTEEIFDAGEKLLYECWKCEPLRLIGMALTDLTTDDFRQISLFENPKEREKQKKADEAFDDIRRRFGNGMIVRGSTMSTAGKVARKAKAQMDQDVRIKKEKEK